MGSYTTSEFQDALLKKGLTESESHHHMYRLYINGRKTKIQTKTSHSEKDYDENLLKQRKQQIGLNTKQQFIDFVKCPMGFDHYKTILIETGRVRVAEPEPDLDSNICNNDHQ